MYFKKNGFPPSHVLDSNEVVFGPMTPTVQQQTTNSDKESFYSWRLQRLKKCMSDI
jgi:hypothetical protein